MTNLNDTKQIILLSPVIDSKNPCMTGVLKKLQGQKTGFEKQGYTVSLLHREGMFFRLTTINGISKWYVSSIREFYHKVLSYLDGAKECVVLLRYPYADYELIRFLYHLRKQNKQRKILIEFPTFPYAKELEGDQELLSIDRFFASFISPFVSHAFSFTNVSKIYGIPTTPVANGITPEEIPIRQYKIPAENRLQLLAVANISTWHGLDRVIEGIHIDLKKHNRSSILFHVVGEGIERNRLEELVCQFGLKKHVIFHGVQTGDALNQFFDQCDLAVGSLGMHRIGLSDASPLKAREYCCRGIPFIIAYQDPSFVNSPFVKVFPATDQAVSMDECRLFLEELRTKKCGSQEIRKHAEIQLSWSTTIQPIIKFCS